MTQIDVIQKQNNNNQIKIPSSLTNINNHYLIGIEINGKVFFLLNHFKEYFGFLGNSSFTQNKTSIRMLLFNKFNKNFVYTLIASKHTDYNWAIKKYRKEWVRFFFSNVETTSEEFLHFNEFNTMGFFNIKKRSVIKSCVSLKRCSGLFRLKMNLNVIFLKKIKHLKFHQKIFDDFKINRFFSKKSVNWLRTKKNMVETQPHELYLNPKSINIDVKNQFNNLISELSVSDQQQNNVSTSVWGDAQSILLDEPLSLKLFETTINSSGNNTSSSDDSSDDDNSNDEVLICVKNKNKLNQTIDFDLHSQRSSSLIGGSSENSESNYFGNQKHFNESFSDDDYDALFNKPRYRRLRKKSKFKNKYRRLKFKLHKNTIHNFNYKFKKSKLNKKSLGIKIDPENSRIARKNKYLKPFWFKKLPLLKSYFNKINKKNNENSSLKEINDLKNKSIFFKDSLDINKKKVLENGWKEKKVKRKKWFLYMSRKLKALEIPRTRLGQRSRQIIFKNRKFFSAVIKKKMKNHWHFSRLIKNFIKKPFKDFILFFDMTLSSVLLRSHFVFGIHDLNYFVNNNFIYVNNKVTTDKLKRLKESDKINLVFNKYYYIYYRNMLNTIKSSFVKLSDYNFMRKLKRDHWKRTPKTDHPSWVKRYIYYRRDIPNFLEVDFMTMTIILIYNPKFMFDLNRNITKFINHYQKHLYNWRFII